MSLRRPLLALALLVASNLHAQGIPWKDGELLVRSVVGQSQTQAIYRVDPDTGHGEELISGFYWWGWAGSLVYDSYRDGLLCNMALQEDPYTFRELYLVDHDGSTTLIPGFFQEDLRALCSVGDGRVYYQHDVFAGPHPIEYLDAANQRHTLMDATGTAPFDFSVEHLLYHAPTNSLLATNSGWWSPNDCVEPYSSFFRIPLSADGSQVVGPVLCTDFGVANDVMSMDYLPGGDVLVNLAGGQFFNECLQRVDPLNLAVSVWAYPSMDDLNGAVWSQRLGRAVLLDDSSNELRLYSAGQTGAGTILATDFSVSPTTTGFSPVETLAEVDLNGPGCLGGAYAYGSGLAGTGGLVPQLALAGCAEVGTSFSLVADEVVGGATGVFLIGFGAAAIPFSGGTLLVSPLATTLTTWASGAQGAAGAGTAQLPLQFGSPSAHGLNLWFQAGFLDLGAPQWVSLSNGLLVTVG